MTTDNRPAAIALGLFDGVHVGHRAVLQAALGMASQGLSPVVFTFPAETAARKGAGCLYPTAVRNTLLYECGAFARLHVPDFAQVQNLDGETFVRTLLCAQDHAAFVCCGRDFRFGKGAAWDVQDLARFGGKYGFKVKIVEDVEADGEKVSSTRIRRLLQEGKIGAANALLGEPYRIAQTVTHGAHLGNTIGFATINQVYAPQQLVPKFGVYASETLTPDGWYASVTNIGIKPTVEYHGTPLAETHILGYEGDLYEREITVILSHFLREERKFDSLGALTAQLAADCDKRRQLSENYHLINT